MPLHYCDLLVTSTYLHKRKCAIITLRKIFEIVYVLNLMSSPVIKQMIDLTFVHNPLFIFKMQFLLSIIILSASHCNLSASKIVMVTYWQVLIHVTCRGGKYAFNCQHITFCIQLNIFIRLGIANSFIFLIFPCCYFYVMSRVTFKHFLIRLGPTSL